MSFGFSIGDTLAVGKLITTIVVCLREVDGSAAEYRLLVQELECLEQTLRRLDALRPVDAKVPGDGGHREASSLDSIKVAALSCRHPLEQFLQGVRKKYGRSLGDAGHSSGAATARSGRVRAAVDKVRFAFWRDDIQTFQSYLSVHIGTINMMLAEHGFERLDRIASSMATKDEEESRRIVKEKMADAQEISSNLQGSLFSQLGAVFNGQAVMNRLLRMMSYDIRSTLSSIETTVAKLWTYTEHIHETLLEIRSRLSTAPDSKWSFFQDPILFEDALGRKLPVPSEYDLSLLNAVIIQRFTDGPGSMEVRHGDYELFDTRNPHQALPSGVYLQPGSSITMAILVPQSLAFAIAVTQCPVPGCISAIASPDRLDTGRVCSRCNTYFGRATKQRASPTNTGMASHQSVEHHHDGEVFCSLPLERSVWSNSFKNIRYSSDIVAPWVRSTRPLFSKAQLLSVISTQSRERPRLGAERLHPDALRTALMEQPLIYTRYLGIMGQIQRGLLSPEQSVGQVRALFHDFPSLIEGFQNISMDILSK